MKAMTSPPPQFDCILPLRRQPGRVLRPPRLVLLNLSSRSDHQLELLLRLSRFNSSAALANGQLVCRPPVRILKIYCVSSNWLFVGSDESDPSSCYLYFSNSFANQYSQEPNKRANQQHNKNVLNAKMFVFDCIFLVKFYYHHLHNNSTYLM